jgi:hypothetical protein
VQDTTLFGINKKGAKKPLLCKKIIIKHEANKNPLLKDTTLVHINKKGGTSPPILPNYIQSSIQTPSYAKSDSKDKQFKRHLYYLVRFY